MINHILIGAGRSGTTTLTEYLKQHPQVNNSIIKEVHYFSLAEKFKKGSSYLSSFFDDKKIKIKSTADTYAFTSLEAPKRLSNYNPTCKITIILRSPVERAFSNYNYAINNGHQSNKISFLNCLKNDAENKIESDIVKQNNLNHFYGGLYYKHISYWLNYFPRDSFFVCTTDELQNHPNQLLKKWFNFLEIDNLNIQEISPQNQSHKVKSKMLQQFLLNRNNWLRKPFKKLPFKQQLVRSGIINWLYNLNKIQGQTNSNLSNLEIEEAKKYFSSDSEKLKKILPNISL